MKFPKLLLGTCCCLFFSGCSVIMAAHETEKIDLTTLRVGTHRSTVEKTLTYRLSDSGSRGGRVATYQYFSGDEASYGRAAVYGLLDVATFGLAEIATTSVESLQGDKHVVTIGYDRDGNVLWLRDHIEKAVLDKPERMLGLEDAPAAKPAVLTAPQPKLPEVGRASL